MSGGWVALGLGLAALLLLPSTTPGAVNRWQRPPAARSPGNTHSAAPSRSRLLPSTSSGVAAVPQQPSHEPHKSQRGNNHLPHPVASWAALGATVALAVGLLVRRWELRPLSRDLSLQPVAMVATSGTEVPATPPPLPPVPEFPHAIAVPRGPQAVAQQALAAALAAHRGGVRRQRHEWLLPVSGASDLDDWPGGIQQQFKAIVPMVEQFLRALKAEPGLDGPLKGRIVDEGDAVGCWEGSNLAAVVFPSGDTLRLLKKLAESERPLLLINPQWREGQVVSDFGIGPWRQRNEEFVDSFEWVYYLKQLRISGDLVFMQRAYPGGWQIHVTDPQGERPCVAVEPTRPSYQRLEEICRAVPWSMSRLSVSERLAMEFDFNARSMDRRND